MDEYITKQEARTALLQRAWKPNEWHDIKSLISSIPPADVRPVVRGKWELDSRGLYSCSCCGQSAPYDVQADIIEYWPHLNYCPNCGADMREADNDPEA